MTVTIGINSGGRIGPCRLAHVAGSNRDHVQEVPVNATGSVETCAHRLPYDSVHGRFAGVVEVTHARLYLHRRQVGGGGRCQRDHPRGLLQLHGHDDGL